MQFTPTPPSMHCRIATILPSCLTCLFVTGLPTIHSTRFLSVRYPDGQVAQGGYADRIRAHQRFVFAIPDKLSSAGAAPLLCAGITTFTPLGQEGMHVEKRGGRERKLAERI